jgi:serine/threonine-protein kinase RsbW
LKTLELTNNISQVPLLGEWVEQLGEELSLPMPTVFQLNLALEEAVVNVINYAYPDQQNQPITLTAKKGKSAEGKDHIIFTLKDNGVAFDPTQQEMPDVTLAAEERSIGGLGIFLVQQMMHSVNYQRQGGSNVLTMEYRI